MDLDWSSHGSSQIRAGSQMEDGRVSGSSRLEDDINDRVAPLIEIPAPGYDFEAQQLKKSNEEHLKDFGKRLSSKWGEPTMFIDLLHFGTSLKVAREHCLTDIFQQTIRYDCKAIPVLNTNSDADFLKAASGFSPSTRLALLSVWRVMISTTLSCLRSSRVYTTRSA